MLRLRTNTRNDDRRALTVSSAQFVLPAILVLSVIAACFIVLSRGANEQDNDAHGLPNASASASPTFNAEDSAAVSRTQQMASLNGGSSTTEVSIVHTDYGSAASVLYPDAPSSEIDRPDPVIVAYAKGEFVGNMTKRPPDTKPPTGPFLFVVFDSATERVRAWGILPSVPELSRLGKVVPAP